jgi:hypothetical protein
MESLRTDLKMKLNEMDSRLEEEQELASNMNERESTAAEEYNSCLQTIEDMKSEMVSLKTKAKQEEQTMKCNLKKGQEECERLVVMEEEKRKEEKEEEKKLEDAREKVRLVEGHILDVSEQAKAFFAEYNAMYEDTIEKMKDQMSCLMESLKREPKE